MASSRACGVDAPDAIGAAAPDPVPAGIERPGASRPRDSTAPGRLSDRRYLSAGRATLDGQEL